MYIYMCIYIYTHVYIQGIQREWKELSCRSSRSAPDRFRVWSTPFFCSLHSFCSAIWAMQVYLLSLFVASLWFCFVRDGSWKCEWEWGEFVFAIVHGNVSPHSHSYWTSSRFRRVRLHIYIYICVSLSLTLTFPRTIVCVMIVGNVSRDSSWNCQWEARWFVTVLIAVDPNTCCSILTLLLRIAVILDDPNSCSSMYLLLRIVVIVVDSSRCDSIWLYWCYSTRFYYYTQ